MSESLAMILLAALVWAALVHPVIRVQYRARRFARYQRRKAQAVTLRIIRRRRA
jgi:nitrate reductase gamma subunit